MKFSLITLLFGLFLSGCTANPLIAPDRNDIPNAKAPPVLPAAVDYKTVQNTTLKLWIYRPPASKALQKQTAIVFFHGGAWRKSDVKQFFRQAYYLAQHGLVAISAEYRVENVHKTTPFEAVADAKSAIRWVRKNKDKLNIASDRIIAGGASAGGQLALATVLLPNQDDPSDDLSVSAAPNALVLFNPALDLKRWENQLHLDMSAISPLEQLKKPLPPTIIFQGTKDDVATVATAQQFTDKALRLGSKKIVLETYPGRVHSFFNFDDDFKSTLMATDRFICNLDWFTC